jgi:hypothetical protein
MNFDRFDSISSFVRSTSQNSMHPEGQLQMAVITFPYNLDFLDEQKASPKEIETGLSLTACKTFQIYLLTGALISSSFLLILIGAHPTGKQNR